MKSYEDLVAWRLAVSACIDVYRVTQRFPSDERFGPTQQLRRAAVSVPSNIAEGYGRGSRQEYTRFLRVARGSLNEVETQLLIAEKLGYFGKAEHDETREKLAEAGRVLAGLIRSLET
ncbi:MAG: four helix bundle protein [Phycisphaeraceae bacterium]|nr:MAG: four helix bundle protein [Phycisphaeraceae bacterium]